MNENQGTPQGAALPASAGQKKDTWYVVQTEKTVESYAFPRQATGKKDEQGNDETMIVPKSSPVKTTKLLKGSIGPFTTRPTAENVAANICMLESIVSAVVFEVNDDPEAQAEKQVPASEDVVRAMAAAGQIPGVPADANVRVEHEADAPVADNTVPFKKPE